MKRCLVLGDCANLFDHLNWEERLFWLPLKKQEGVMTSSTLVEPLSYQCLGALWKPRTNIWTEWRITESIERSWKIHDKKKVINATNRDCLLRSVASCMHLFQFSHCIRAFLLCHSIGNIPSYILALHFFACMAVSNTWTACLFTDSTN